MKGSTLHCAEPRAESVGEGSISGTYPFVMCGNSFAQKAETLEVLHLHMAFPVVVNILPCLTGCQIRSMFSATPPKGISRVMILPMLRSELDTCPSLTKI